MSWRGDLVTALLSAWLISGVFLDTWAHATRPTLETFFTPWHAVLYSGFVAVAGWIIWTVAQARRRGGGLDGPPPGYRLAGWGVVVFGIAGLGDMLWHVVFGIERELAALLSPTHLGLFVGMLLIVTAPARSAWARPDLSAAWAALLPAALALALAGTLTAFLLQPFHPMAHNFVSRSLAELILQRSGGSRFVMARHIQVGLAGFVFGTLCLFVPVLLLARRWRAPAGMLAGMLTLQCVLLQGSGGFRDPLLAALGGLGSLGVEALARALRPESRIRSRLLAFAALAPPLFWSVYMAGIAVRDGGLGWPIEIWSGTLVWSGFSLVAVALAMSGGAGSARPPVVRSTPVAYEVEAKS
jgi:hypothetical protein